MAACIDCSRAWLGLNKVVHCPSICHALQVKYIAVSGMPILIRETHYDPCSQAKIGGTLRQLGSISYKHNVYCSIRDLSVQMASIDVKAYCASGANAKERWVCCQGNVEVRGPECWKLANELTGIIPKFCPSDCQWTSLTTRCSRVWVLLNRFDWCVPGFLISNSQALDDWIG